MSFSSFYSVVNAIKDKSAEAMTTLSSDLQDFKSIVQEDVAELSKNVRQNMQDGRLSVERKDSDVSKETMQDQHVPEDPTQTEKEDEQEQDTMTSLKNSLFSFDISSTLGSLNSVGNSMQDSLSSVQGSLTSVGSKLTSLDVGSSLGSLEAMGSKLLNSADEFLGTLAGDAAYEGEEELTEDELSARRFRLLALQEDSDTYLEPPLDIETFEKWKLATSTEELTEIKKEVLENYPTVGTKLTELVPSLVEENVFWLHYIYKAALLAAQEQRGADLLEHALNDDEEDIGWDDDSKPIFSDDEAKEEEKAPVSAIANAPTSSGGESWIELDERKESISSGASSSIKEASTALADLKLEEGDEAAEEDSLDWGDDDDLSVPETATASDAATEVTPAAHEDVSKRGEDWGEWD